MRRFVPSQERLKRNLNRAYRLAAFVFLLISLAFAYQKKVAERRIVPLPTSKQLLAPAPGRLDLTNGLPVTAALSPNSRYLALLNAGFGTAESDYRQSISIVDLETNKVADFPDARLGKHA